LGRWRQYFDHFECGQSISDYILHGKTVDGLSRKWGYQSLQDVIPQAR
jgi:hypothetical protein